MAVKYIRRRNFFTLNLRVGSSFCPGYPAFGFVRFFLFMMLCVNGLHAGNLHSEAQREVIPLHDGIFEHITFRKIKANRYSYNDQQLHIDVDESASFLMLPFDSIKKISSVSFEWRSDGVPLVEDLKHEKERSGDDAVFKIGLLLKTDDSLPNPFFSSWIKQVDTLLNFPSDQMVYLVPNAQHPAGEQWVNPYNKRITMISVRSRDGKSGWQLSSHRFEQPLDVVAIWLMADGDNTKSKFFSYVKNIKIE